MTSKQLRLRWIITPLMLLGLSIVSFAQNIQLKGKVIDADTKIALEAATVLVKGQNQSARTNANGQFTISNVSPNASIVVSYVGYTTKTVGVSAGELVIALVKEDVSLNEVVVTALGIKRNVKSLTYARQSINTEGVGEDGSINFMNSLQGKAAGLQIVSAGTPTGSTRVVIRGITSVTGNNQPLYVIDGYAIGGNTSQGQGNGGNATNGYNPATAMEVDVLFKSI